MDKNSARTGFWFLLDAVLAVLIIGSLFGIGAIIRQSNAVTPSRTITVSGEGKTTVTPDLATLSFSVVSQGTDPDAIQKDNTKKINLAIDFVKSQGVAARDITTSGYNLYPRYNYDKNGGNPSIAGYELTQTVTVKIRDLASVGKIVGGLPAQGINQIGSLNFSIEDPEAQKNKAREQAFANALAKAQVMAGYNGVRIARVISFQESDGGYPIPMYARAEMMGKGGVASAPPTIEPGQQDLTVNVSVTYEIR